MNRWLGKPVPRLFDVDVSTTTRRWEARMADQDDESAAGDWRRSVGQASYQAQRAAQAAAWAVSAQQQRSPRRRMVHGGSAGTSGTYRDQYVKDAEQGVGIALHKYKTLMGLYWLLQ